MWFRGWVVRRCGLAGVDLNRKWQSPSALLHPTINNFKKYLRGLAQTRFGLVVVVVVVVVVVLSKVNANAKSPKFHQHQYQHFPAVVWSSHSSNLSCNQTYTCTIGNANDIAPPFVFVIWSRVVCDLVGLPFAICICLSQTRLSVPRSARALQVAPRVPLRLRWQQQQQQQQQPHHYQNNSGSN